MKEENATNSFLDVSLQAPRFDIDNASTDSEAEDESMLFHTKPAPPIHSTTIPEADEAETNSDVASSRKGASSSTTKNTAGSIISSILGHGGKRPVNNLDSLRYLDNSMMANGTGDMTIDDDVSYAETSVDGSLLERTADDILRGKDANLLSDMPSAYRMKGDEESSANDEQSIGATSYDGSFHEM